MERELGRTGIKVFPVGLGCRQLSAKGHPTEAKALKVILAALEAGMNFLDTADVYCTLENGGLGSNERLIQKALKLSGKTKSVTVTTKGGVDRYKGGVDASPKFLRNACIASLKALKQETIPLYQIHSFDGVTPIEESVGALARLKEEGKILHIGLCNVSLKELKRALKVARIETVQNRCNPFVAEDYADGMLKACEKNGVSYLPHTVVGGKNLHESVAEHPLLIKLGKKYGVSPYVVVVAWHLAKSPRVIPIPGASRPESAVSSASAASVELAPADIRRIDSLN